MKKAIITGIYGQDGSFLCEKLWKQGYQIYGIGKKSLSANAERIKSELAEQGVVFELFNTDIYDYLELCELIRRIQPDEIYHMAAYHMSAEGKGNAALIREQEVFNKNVLATANILEACFSVSPQSRILTAGSCLMFDASDTECQTEDTAFCSQSLYGLAKIAENMLVRYYREKGLYCCTAILYNHESHRRASGFVTKKVIENMVKIKNKEIDSFCLGNLNTEKDWGYAGDYVQAMYLMLQAEEAKDYILSTGKMHTIRDFLSECARQLKIENWEKYVVYDDKLIKRTVKGRLRGDSSAVEKALLWKREKGFSEMIEEMLKYEEWRG